MNTVESTTNIQPPHTLNQHHQQEQQHHHKIDEFIAYENGVLLNNRYLKLNNIQDGSYGKVSVALDTYTNEKVAIKSMYKKNKGVSAIARHEISILKKLGQTCENICHLLNHFQTSDYYFLIFEYCSNGDLYDYLKNIDNHLNPNFKNGSLVFFKQFIKELANAMNFAHSKGIYHRDIKPENILIDSKGSIKLTDWGLATVGSRCFDPCIGTEKYMAPETFFKLKKTKNPEQLISYDSIKSDYWSFGITILYTLFGSCPFKIANLKDEGFKRFLQDPEFLFKIYPNLTQHGFEIVLSLLQINPQNRSIDHCLELINSYFNVGLTYDQEIEQEDISFDESFIFGMDESIEHHQPQPQQPQPQQPQEQSLSLSFPEFPPSLTSSFPNNFSWADEIDPNMVTFNFEQVNNNQLPQKSQQQPHQTTTPTMLGGTPLQYHDFDWY